MLDMTAVTSTAPGFLSKLSVERDGTDKDGLVFTTQLAFSVNDAADADIIDRFLRGARAYYDSKQGTELTGAMKDSPGNVSGRFRLVYPDDGVTVIDAQGEVQRVEMVKARKACSFTVTIQFHGLTPVVAAHFAAHLARRLDVFWTAPIPNQTAIPFASPTPSNAVQVVTISDGNGGFLFGAQTGLDGDKILIDDFGRGGAFSKSAITSKIIIAPEDGVNGKPMFEIMAPVAQQIREAGGQPSWKWVILAIAAERGTELEEAVYRVTPAELARTVALAIDAVTS